MFQYHFVHHELHLKSPGIEPESPRWETSTSRMSYGTRVKYGEQNRI
jgi:hypothetical protein